MYGGVGCDSEVSLKVQIFFLYAVMPKFGPGTYLAPVPPSPEPLSLIYIAGGGGNYFCLCCLFTLLKPSPS